MPTHEPSRGALSFQAFLTEHGLSDPAAAKLLGVTVVTLYHWRIGYKTPKPGAQRKIEKFTTVVYADRTTVAKQGIPPSDWDGGAEDRELEAIASYVVLKQQPPKRRSKVRSSPQGEDPSPSQRVPTLKKPRSSSPFKGTGTEG